MPLAVDEVPSVDPGEPASRAGGVPRLRWSGEFADIGTEAAFRAQHLAATRRPFAAVAAVAAACFVGFGASDVAALGWGTRAGVLVAIRLVVGAALVALAAGVWHRPAWVAGPAGVRAVTAVEAAAFASFLTVCLLRPVGFTNLHVSAVLLALAILTLGPGPVRPRLAVTGGFGMAYLAVTVAHFDDPVARPLPLAALVACSLLMGGLLAVTLARAHRLAFAALAAARHANAALERRVDEAQQLGAELARQVATDELTGVTSRRVFLERAEAVFARADHDRSTVYVLLLDVDGFKAINDRHGHAAGDDTLRKLGSALNAAVRPGDLVGRLGGEEFAAVLAGVDAVRAAHRAAQIRDRVAATSIVVDGCALVVTVSVGLVAREPGEPLPETLRRADLAMYAAKRAGGNRIAAA